MESPDLPSRNLNLVLGRVRSSLYEPMAGLDRRCNKENTSLVSLSTAKRVEELQSVSVKVCRQRCCPCLFCRVQGQDISVSYLGFRDIILEKIQGCVALAQDF